MRRFFLQRNPAYRGISLYITDDTAQPAGRVAVATNITFESTHEALIPQPLTTLELNEAQELMDELWNCGIRPTDGAGSAGAMHRAEMHIADLRKIAFKALKIEG